MRWTSPIWLLELVPWAALAVWLWRPARRVADVPNLALWPTTGVGRRAGRVWGRPPAAVLAGLTGLLLGVGVAVGPSVTRSGGRPVTVVLDRGVTMAGRDGGPPFRGVLGRAVAVVGTGPVRLVCVPAVAGQSDQPTDDWAERARHVAPTAVDTAAALVGTVAELRRQVAGPVVVLTDQPVPVREVIRVEPDRPRDGPGIVAVAARAVPLPQVMIRVVGRSRAGETATVRVRSATAGERAAGVPASGGAVDVFVDGVGLGDVVQTSVGSDTVDGNAWLVRAGEPAAVVAAPGVAAAVRRMAAVFDQRVGPTSARPALATGAPLPVDRAGVQVTDTPGDAGPAVVASHPVTVDVSHWIGSGGVPPPGFGPVVSRAGGRALVAVRAGPPRQVWVNVDVGRMARTVDWVVLMANAFRWVGGDGERYVASAPRPLGRQWVREAGTGSPGVEPGLWPGLYRSADGGRVAINAAEPAGGATATTVAAPAPAASSPAEATGRAIGGALAAVAVGCLAVAGAVWPAGGGGRRGARVGGRPDGR